jgi:hypothetical protein
MGEGSAVLCCQFGHWLFPGAVKPTLARLIGTSLGGAYGAGVVLPHPGLALSVAGAGISLWCLAAWTASEAGEEPEDGGEVEYLTRDDAVELLWDLVGDGRGVLLTVLRNALQWETTKEVRDFLTDEDIPVRAGVRTVAGNGPGVHRDDFPPLPSPVDELSPVGVVAAGEDANANANNGPDQRDRLRKIHWPPRT